MYDCNGVIQNIQTTSKSVSAVYKINFVNTSGNNRPFVIIIKYIINK